MLMVYLSMEELIAEKGNVIPPPRSIVGLDFGAIRWVLVVEKDV